MATRVPYLKMNGLGNDFVVLDARARALELTPEIVAAISSRESGIGCDQFIVIEPARDGGDAFMDIWNNDGERVEACGNATRCIGDLLMQESGKEEVAVETVAGTLRAMPGKDGLITVDMGEPRLEWHQIPLSEEIRDTRGIELQIGPIDAPILHTPAAVNMGNPHAIFFVQDVNAYNLAQIGPMLEHHPIFPERANISLAQVDSRTHITLRVWERGAGLTRACGTAACAAGVAAIRKRLTERIVQVALPGGELTIEWREADNHVYMTGPAELDYKGELDWEAYAGRSAS
jgi:diaminopimelate epimerase